MQNQIIHPTNEAHWLELRKPDITSTEISCLFDCSPYATRFELWHRKKKNMETDFEANERTDWGLVLQDSIMSKFAKDNKWVSKRKTEYIRIPDLNIGASFDFDVEISTPRLHEPFICDISVGLAEVKNVDSKVFKDGWIVEDDYIEAPPHIEFQAQQQMLVSGAPFNYILGLVGGNRGVKLLRTPNQKIFDAIIQRSQEFWKSIQDNNPPPARVEVDYEFISSLYKQANEGEILDARGNSELLILTAEYNKFQKEQSEAEKNKKIAKAKILPLIGTAEKVVVDGYSISCGETSDVEVVAHTRSGYRGFRVYKKEEK